MILLHVREALERERCSRRSFKEETERSFQLSRRTVSEAGRGQRFSSAITLRSTAARIFPGINASGYPARGEEIVIHGRLKVSSGFFFSSR